MSIGTFTWLAGLFVVSITANTGLLKIITDDKLRRPNLIAAFLNASLSFVGGLFGYLLVGYAIAIVFVLFNGVSYIVLVYIVKKRDVRAVKLGENLLATFQRVDLQISFVLNEILVNPASDLGRPIRRTIRYILAELSNLLGFDSTHHPQLVVLIPENHKFKVLAYSGIPNHKLAKLENTFQYGPQPISLAGHAMNRRKPIIINDLADARIEDGVFWIQVSTDEPRSGSILAYPIIRGIGSSDTDPIAILCITSDKKGAFDVEIVIQLLTYFSSKFEILQNCWDIVACPKRV